MLVLSSALVVHGRLDTMIHLIHLFLSPITGPQEFLWIDAFLDLHIQEDLLCLRFGRCAQLVQFGPSGGK